MSIASLIGYVLLLVLCLFSFIVLQQHYTERLTWGQSFVGATKKIGPWIIVAIFNPVAYFALMVIAAFLVYSLLW